MWDIKGGFQCFNTPTQGRNALCCVQVQSGWWSSKTTTKAVDEEVHDNALIQGVQKHVLVLPWLSVCEQILCVCVGMCTVSGTSSGLGLDLSNCIPTEWSPEMKRTRRVGAGRLKMWQSLQKCWRGWEKGSIETLRKTKWENVLGFITPPPAAPPPQTT